MLTLSYITLNLVVMKVLLSFVRFISLFSLEFTTIGFNLSRFMRHFHDNVSIIIIKVKGKHRYCKTIPVF